MDLAVAGAESQICSSMYHHLRCPVCFQLRDDLQVLECLHTLCCACLNTILSGVNSENGKKCPECRKDIVVPDTGFKLDRQKNNIINELKSSIFRPCSKHPNEYVQKYCQTCQRSLCIDCVGESEHKGHDLENISKTNETTLQKIQKHLKILEDKINIYRTKAAECLDYKNEIIQNKDNFKRDLESALSDHVNACTKKQKRVMADSDKKMNENIRELDVIASFFNEHIEIMQSEQEKLKQLIPEFVMEIKIEKVNEVCQKDDIYFIDIENKQNLNIEKINCRFIKQKLPNGFDMFGVLLVNNIPYPDGEEV